MNFYLQHLFIFYFHFMYVNTYIVSVNGPMGGWWWMNTNYYHYLEIAPQAVALSTYLTFLHKHDSVHLTKTFVFTKIMSSIEF